MLNDKFKAIHLKQRKITTPLFANATEAFSISSQNWQHSSKYLVIDSNVRIKDHIFKDTHLCPIYIYNDKSYIILEGTSLLDYFLARRQKDIVLTEEQIWILMMQITQTLLVLREVGYQHHNLHLYSIRRINSSNFKLIYHPEMCSFEQLTRENKRNWYDCYFSPQELNNVCATCNSSIVFTLGYLVLNIMNPLDSTRDIYQRRSFSINQAVLLQKINNSYSFYSHHLINLIKECLLQNFKERLTLNQLYQKLLQLNPMEKKHQMHSDIRSYVWQRLEKSRSNSNKNKNSPKITSQYQFPKPTIKRSKVQLYKKKDEHLSLSEKAKANAKNHQNSSNSKTAQSQTQKLINFHRGTFGAKRQQSENEYVSQNQSLQNSTHNYMDQTKISKVYNEYSPKLPQTKFPNVNELIDNIRKSNIYEEETKHKVEEKLVKNDRYQFITNSNLSLSSQADKLGQPSNAKVDEYLSKRNDEVIELKLQTCLLPSGEIAKMIGQAGVWIDGDIYFGRFSNGRRDGLGLEIFPEQEYYFGYFCQDMFHGEGFYYWSPTQYFLGVFQNGQKIKGQLFGRIKYEGQFKNNKRHGYGKCIYEDGTMYEGWWQLGKKHGEGTLIEITGARFQGSFKNGKRYGRGTYTEIDSMIEGIWQGDKLIGEVTITYSDGNVYIGELNKNYQKHGFGIIFFSNKSCYQKGQFVNDNFVKGQILYKNGDRYEGPVINNNQRHGFGVYYYSDGGIYEGEWAFGKKVAH